MGEINNKLIYFGSNGVVIFIGVHSDVTTKICKKRNFFHVRALSDMLHI
jgi:hypothetical protein